MEDSQDQIRPPLSRSRFTPDCPETTKELSVIGTTALLPSPSSSYVCSSSESAIGGDIDSEIDPRTRNVISGKTIRKRPRISDLQQHVSTSKIPNEQHPAQQTSKSFTPSPKRRCVSACATIKFTTPDRYIPHRPLLGEESPSYRTSKPPSTLRDRERYNRARDHRADPFRSVSEARSNQIVSRQRANNAHQLQPPRYTPSFVYGADAGPFTIEPRPGAESLRQLSWGGFWTVGGRSASYFGQLNPVPTGGTSMLTSGTNAPMHTPGFLDMPNKDDLVRAHEGRLALALDIDQAARVLHHSPQRQLDAPVALRSAAVRWQNGEWIRPHHPRGIHPCTSLLKPY